MFERLIRQVRYASRLLARSPGFTFTAVLSLAIGIGANTTIFTVANGLLLAPTKGIPDVDRLVDVGRSTHGQGFDTVSYSTYLDLRDRNNVFSGMYAVRGEPRAFSLGGPEGGERVYAEQVSASYFDVLGVAPELGTFFRTDEEHLGTPLRKVVLTHKFWRQRFNGDPAIVGRDITLNGDQFSVTAVGRADFAGATALTPDLWVPMTAYGTAMVTDQTLRGRPNNGFIMGARLRPGVSIAQARAQLDAIFAQLTREYPNIYSDRGLVVLPSSRLPGVGRIFVAPFLAVLMALVGLVLLVACTNLAGLLLARAASRTREVAVRLALGASRRALLGHLLTESLLLFALGGAAGLALAHVMTAALLSLLPDLPFPIALDLPLDRRVLAFTIGVVLLTGVLTGLVPALQSARPNLSSDLKGDAGGPRRQRLRHLFIAAQLALCLVLTVTAGLFLRALSAAVNVSPGFDVDPIEVATIDLSIAGYSEAARPAAAAELRERLTSLAGIDQVAVAAVIPLEGSALGLGELRRPGRAADRGADVDWNVISPEFLSAIGLPIARGRNFTRDDHAGAPLAAIINEQLARRMFAGEDPIGQVLESGEFSGGANDVRRFTIVGVARDARYQWLGEGPKNFIYVPIAQQPVREVNYFLRHHGSNAADLQTAGIRHVLKAFNPNLPLIRDQRLRDLADLGLLPQRLAASVAGSLGVVALLLAGIGLYGVMAYAVACRTREIGLRMALGADRPAIMRSIVGQAVRLVTVGAAVGLGLAFAVTRLLSSFLFGVSPLDPIAFGTTVVVLAAVALAASYAPARRAANVNPLTALRAD